MGSHKDSPERCDESRRRWKAGTNRGKRERGRKMGRKLPRMWGKNHSRRDQTDTCWKIKILSSVMHEIMNTAFWWEILFYYSENDSKNGHYCNPVLRPLFETMRKEKRTSSRLGYTSWVWLHFWPRYSEGLQWQGGTESLRTTCKAIVISAKLEAMSAGLNNQVKLSLYFAYAPSHLRW